MYGQAGLYTMRDGYHVTRCEGGPGWIEQYLSLLQILAELGGAFQNGLPGRIEKKAKVDLRSDTSGRFNPTRRLAT